MVMAANYNFNYEGQPVDEDGSSAFDQQEKRRVEDHGVLNGSGQISYGPCIVYFEVNGTWYLDLDGSKRNSPLFTKDMILEASIKAHGELPLLGGLEQRIVEKRRKESMERWASQPKKRHER